MFQQGNKNQYRKDTEEEKRAYVESFMGGAFSYVGGYIDCEHKVTIRCNKCGAVFERSMVSIRHGTAVCEICKRMEAKAKAEAEKEANRIKRQEERERRRLERAEEKAQSQASRIHCCPVCGTQTVRRKYCSDVCMKKANNSVKESVRRAKINAALIDKDIEIHKLFKRDHGVCYLCGGLCNWEDKEEKPQGIIICGDTYPSIDHVIPLTKGGLHEWANVKLAHRYCNSVKQANVPPLGL